MRSISRSPLRHGSIFTVAVAAAIGCGSSSSSSGRGDAGPPADAASDAGPDAAPACGPGKSDPGQLRCGTETCTTPSQVCCYHAPNEPRCTTAADCAAADGFSFECDEDSDCAASGAYCCSGVVARNPDGTSVGVTVGTSCTTDPTSCLPQPGVGSSSFEACQVDSECHGGAGPCVAQTCDGQCIHLCGLSGNCHE